MLRETMDAGAAEYAANQEQVKQDFQFAQKNYQEGRNSLQGESLYDVLRKDHEFFENLEKEI